MIVTVSLNRLLTQEGVFCVGLEPSSCNEWACPCTQELVRFSGGVNNLRWCRGYSLAVPHLRPSTNKFVHGMGP